MEHDWTGSGCMRLIYVGKMRLVETFLPLMQVSFQIDRAGHLMTTMFAITAQIRRQQVQAAEFALAMVEQLRRLEHFEPLERGDYIAHRQTEVHAAMPRLGAGASDHMPNFSSCRTAPAVPHMMLSPNNLGPSTLPKRGGGCAIRGRSPSPETNSLLFSRLRLFFLCFSLAIDQ